MASGSKILICPETGNVVVNQGKIVMVSELYLHLDNIQMGEWLSHYKNSLIGDIGIVGKWGYGKDPVPMTSDIDSRNRGDNSKIRYVPINGNFNNVSSRFSRSYSAVGAGFPVTNSLSNFSVVGIVYDHLFIDGVEGSDYYFGMMLIDPDGNKNFTGRISKPGVYTFICFPVYSASVQEYDLTDINPDTGNSYRKVEAQFKMMPCINKTNSSQLYYQMDIGSRTYNLPYAHDFIRNWEEGSPYYKTTEKCYASAKIVVNDQMEIASVTWQNVIDNETDTGLLFGLGGAYGHEVYCDIDEYVNGVVSFPFNFSIKAKEEEEPNGN